VGRPYRIGKLPGAISSMGFPGADASGTKGAEVPQKRVCDRV
jgi:hypothetical protein